MDYYRMSLDALERHLELLLHQSLRYRQKGQSRDAWAYDKRAMEAGNVLEERLRYIHRPRNYPRYR